MKSKRVKLVDRVGEIKGNLEILRLSDRERHVIVTCKICQNDPEMFGNGEFEIFYSNFTRGILPCGCSKSANYSPKQYEIRVRRKLKEFPHLELVDFDYDSVGIDSKLTTRCSIHGTYIESVSIHTFLSERHKGMCIDCEKEYISSRKTKDLSDLNSRLYKMPEGSYVLRSDEDLPLDKLGRKSGKYLLYNCGVCSSDKFVEAGLCSGLFRATIASFGVNNSCRCSDKFKYTDSQLKFRVEERFHELGITNNHFCGIIHKSKKVKSRNRRILFECDMHGYYSKNYSNISFKENLIKCPDCAEFGGFKISKEGYLYVLEVSKDDEVNFIGFGISNIPESRLITHKAKLGKAYMHVTNTYLFKGSGRRVLATESEIKRVFNIESQEITGFRKEAVSVNDKDNLLNFIEQRLDKVSDEGYYSTTDY